MELTQLDSWTHLWYKKNAAAHSLLSFWASLHSFRAVPYSLKNNPRQASKIVRRLQLNYEVDIKESYKISIFSSRKIFCRFFFLKYAFILPSPFLNSSIVLLMKRTAASGILGPISCFCLSVVSNAIDA